MVVRYKGAANANRILLRSQKEKYKILPDISPDHRGREKYTRNFAPLAARMLRTGFRHASLAEPGCALCATFPEFRTSCEYSHAQPLVSKLPDGFGGECEPDSAAPEGRAEPDSMRGWRPQRTKKATLLGCFVRWRRVDKKDAYSNSFKS